MDLLIAKRVPSDLKVSFCLSEIFVKSVGPINNFSVYEDLFSSFIYYLMPIVFRSTSLL